MSFAVASALRQSPASDGFDHARPMSSLLGSARRSGSGAPARTMTSNRPAKPTDRILSLDSSGFDCGEYVRSIAGHLETVFSFLFLSADHADMLRWYATRFMQILYCKFKFIARQCVPYHGIKLKTSIPCRVNATAGMGGLSLNLPAVLHNLNY